MYHLRKTRNDVLARTLKVCDFLADKDLPSLVDFSNSLWFLDDSSLEAEGRRGAADSDDESETGSQFAVEDLMDTMTPEEEALEKPSLDNFKSYLGRISLEGLRRRLASRDRTNARPSNAALAALLTAENDFRKTIGLIAWAAGLSEATAEKYA